MNKKRNFGFSSILLAFVAVCLITFCALSYVSVHTDYVLTKKVVQNNTDYHLAETKAYDELFRIDSKLAKLYNNCSDASSFYLGLEDALSEFDGSYSNEDNSHTYSYTIPVNEKQDLLVRLQLCYPTTPDASFYQLESFHTVSVGEEDAQNGIVTFE